MAASKIAITIEKSILSRIDVLVKENKYPSRSRAIQEMLEGKIQKLERSRLAEECGKLDSSQERELAEEGFRFEVEQWPEF